MLKSVIKGDGGLLGRDVLEVPHVLPVLNEKVNETSEVLLPEVEPVACAGSTSCIGLQALVERAKLLGRQGGSAVATSIRETPLDIDSIDGAGAGDGSGVGSVRSMISVDFSANRGAACGGGVEGGAVSSRGGVYRSLGSIEPGLHWEDSRRF